MKPTQLKVPKSKKYFQHKKKYKGFPMKQADGVISVFSSFFEREKFDRVIELGTGSGGFCLYLGETFKNNFYTFDVTDKLSKVDGIKKRLRKLNINIYLENIFETDTVRDIIQMDGRVLLLCDNGNKPLEVDMFSPCLKPNDVIMVHDYFKDEESYLKQSRWKTCGFIDEYVKSDKTLIPFYQEEFSTVYWFCRIKGFDK